MSRNKVVWDKHYNSNRLTVRNIFLFCYSRFRLMGIFKITHLLTCFFLNKSFRSATKHMWTLQTKSDIYLNNLLNTNFMAMIPNLTFTELRETFI